MNNNIFMALILSSTLAANVSIAQAPDTNDQKPQRSFAIKQINAGMLNIGYAE